MVSAAMPASAHINLLQNPGFETGVPPWIIDGNGVWNGGLYGPGHTGNNFAWISTELGAGEAWIWQHIDPPRCAEYLELYYLPRGGGGAGMWVGVLYSDDTYHWEELPTWPGPGWRFLHVDLDTTKLVETVEVEIEGNVEPLRI
jgi:hypothetical protein